MFRFIANISLKTKNVCSSSNRRHQHGGIRSACNRSKEFVDKDRQISSGNVEGARRQAGKIDPFNQLRYRHQSATNDNHLIRVTKHEAKMHIEVQVALNFVISYLYNKLPRRRVNIFGEELEKALKDKFQGHWYPDKPFKGSAFRCLKTGDPIDKVLERAARESGVPIQDILENLPQELAVWVDPGEVSYRIGEKGAVKILFSEKADPQDEHSADREVTKTFNPEAQCFRPIESVGCSLSNLTLSPKSVTPFASNQPQQPPVGTQMPPPMQTNNLNPQNASNQAMNPISPSTAPSPTSMGNSFKGSPSPVPAFIPRTTTPLTFTTATFAQTKFGSTKLKTNSKRANRYVIILRSEFWAEL